MNRSPSPKCRKGATAQVSLLTSAAAYIQVVLQRLWSGSAAGRETVVVLEGVRVGQQLFHLPAGVGQLASDGAELGQRDSRCSRRNRKGSSEEVWLQPTAFFTVITQLFTRVV